MSLVAVVAAGTLAAGLVGAHPAAAADPPSSLSLATGEVVDASGDSVGAVFAFDDGTSTVWLIVATGLEPGLHGVQLHAVGDCDGGFAGVGPRVAGAPLATLGVDDHGIAQATFMTESSGLADLDDADDFSLVVHDRPDNRANVPARYQSTDSSDVGPDAQTLDTGDVGGGAACAEMVVESDIGRARVTQRRDTWARSAARRFTSHRAARGIGPRAAAVDYVQADLVDVEGTRRGRVRLAAGSEGPGAVLPEVTGLDAGVYGIQVHTGGACTGTDFADAGPRDAGTDLPDLVTAGAAEGPRTFNASTAALPSLAALLQGDGATLVIHTKSDNHANIPARYTADGAGAPGPDATTVATGDTGVGVLCGRLRTVPVSERYIDAIYGRLLQRPVEPTATAAWTAYLGRHSRSSFVAAVMSSLEARRALVRDLYGYHLGANPDPSGLAYWSGRMADPSFNEDELVATLMGTGRFYAYTGGTTVAFVTAVYGIVLFRDPTAAERSLWRTYLGRGGSRRAMAAQLLGSAEGRANAILDEYLFTIDREPELPELFIWLDYLHRGGRYRGLRTFLQSGNEFYELAATSGASGGFFFIL
jgi:Cu-Zn family superoxide dismutase